MGLYGRWLLRERNKILRDGIAGNYGGILISDITPLREQSEEFTRFITEALQCIEQNDLRRFTRVQRELRCIANFPMFFTGSYFKETRHCVIDFSRYSGRIEGDKREWYVGLCAGLIVHEAMHGVLYSRGVPYNEATWERVEMLCRLEQQRFVRRLQSERWDFAALVIEFDRDSYRHARSKWPWHRAKMLFDSWRRVEQASRPRP